MAVPGGAVPDPKKWPKLSRLGELLNTQKNVHFFVPGAGPGGGARGGSRGGSRGGCPGGCPGGAPGGPAPPGNFPARPPAPARGRPGGVAGEGHLQVTHPVITDTVCDVQCRGLSLRRRVFGRPLRGCCPVTPRHVVQLRDVTLCLGGRSAPMHTQLRAGLFGGTETPSSGCVPRGHGS